MYSSLFWQLEHLLQFDTILFFVNKFSCRWLQDIEYQSVFFLHTDDDSIFLFFDLIHIDDHSELLSPQNSAFFTVQSYDYVSFRLQQYDLSLSIQYVIIGLSFQTVQFQQVLFDFLEIE